MHCTGFSQGKKKKRSSFSSATQGEKQSTLNFVISVKDYMKTRNNTDLAGGLIMQEAYSIEKKIKILTFLGRLA